MESQTTDPPESDIETLPKFIIVLLMGLPGSGKTTLCRTIPHILGENYRVLHVCFDHLVQFREEWSSGGSTGKWKNERAKLLQAVEELIKGLISGKEAVRRNKTDLESKTSQIDACGLIFQKNSAKSKNLLKNVGGEINSQHIGDLDSRVVSDVHLSGFKSSSKFSSEDFHGKYTLISDILVQDLNFIYNYDLHDKMTLLCVDDNFYYHSMRKEWWNLAAKYELAFCTLVVSCELDICIERVKIRESLCPHSVNAHVPIEVIKRMSNNLELPNEKLYHWEKYWTVIDTSDLKFVITEISSNAGRETYVFDKTSMQKFEKINEIFYQSLLDPAKPLSDQVKVENVIATPSIIHEIDLSLRKIVGKSEKSLKTHVNKRRKEILEGLKSGKICIPKELTDAEISSEKKLENFVIALIELEEIKL